ncbi:MAG: hypothetical protein ACOYYS_00755 [Chloroflexota bacterium]
MKKKITTFGITLVVACLLAAGVFVSAKASTLYSKKQTTGYAMGATGYGSHTFVRGDVATHPMGYCGDSAGYWSRGTRLNVTSGIPIPGYSGFNPSYDIFWTLYKWDTGDLQCVKESYWLDIYFSRYIRNSSEGCSCPGVTTPSGSCYLGAATNSCTSATAYGAPRKSYYGP